MRAPGLHLPTETPKHWWVPSPGGECPEHNEQAKCYRTWQGRITVWGRRKLRPAILWCSLLPVSGCSRTESIEVIWKNCWRGGVLRPFQAFIDDVPGMVLGVVAAVLPADQVGDLGKAQREDSDPLRDLQSVREGQADFPAVAVVVAVSAVP